MIQALFEFPLPNNGDRYDLSKEELVELLQKAYEKGKQSIPEYSTYAWSNTICPACGSGSVYTTVTAMNGPGNVATYHCSDCGYSWDGEVNAYGRVL